MYIKSFLSYCLNPITNYTTMISAYYLTIICSLNFVSVAVIHSKPVCYYNSECWYYAIVNKLQTKMLIP